MSKGKTDKFLPVYFGGLGAIALGLGWMAFSSSGAASDAKSKFENAKVTLEKLQTQKLFPNDANATEKEKRVAALAQEGKGLIKALQAYQQPLDAAATNGAFSKKLTESIKSVTDEAKGRRVGLPKDFDFGYKQYKTTACLPEAAPALTMQLDALHFLVRTVMESGVTKIDDLRRGEMAVEKETSEAKPTTTKDAKQAKTPKAAPKPKGKPAMAGKGPATPKPTVVVLDESKVLERIPVEIEVTGNDNSTAAILEALANTSPDKQQPYFFALRAMRVENEKKSAPDKSMRVAVREETDQETKQPIKYDVEYIFGGQPVKMSMMLDLIRFKDAEVEPAPTTGAKKPTSK